MVLVWNAVELDHRSRLPDRATKSLPAKTLKRLTKFLLAIGVVVIVTGTIVTGSGPHSGAEKQQILEALENQGEIPAISTIEVEVERLPFDVPDVARIHGISVMIFLLLTLRLLFIIKRNSPTLLPNSQNLMAAITVQAGIGYLQYFTGVPALLVGIHVAGATLIWVMILRLYLAVHQPIPEKSKIAAQSPT
tara:strand:- start:471 stop:1046 length:576 start_codon:yes stop_codon:yes gene_type:complete